MKETKKLSHYLQIIAGIARDEKREPTTEGIRA